jgi:hypothetical protein
VFDAGCSMLGVRCGVVDTRNVDAVEHKNTRSCCIYCCFLTGSGPDAASLGGDRRTRAAAGDTDQELTSEAREGEEAAAARAAARLAW